jgi:hypothetical protein
LTLLFELRLFGRNNPNKFCYTAVSKYDYHDAFAPHFYSKMEQVLVQQGQPVPNIGKTADYQLTAKLDENNEISEQELLHTQITVLINGFCLDEFRSKFI